MSFELQKLAEELNISTKFSYGCGEVTEVNVSDEMLKFFIKGFGYGANSDEDIKKSLEKIAKKRWQRVMEAIYIVNDDNKVFDIVVSDEELKAGIEVKYALEGGKTFKKLDVEFVEIERNLDKKTEYVLLNGVVKNNLEPNYYDIKVITSKGEYKTVMAVCPKECYHLDKKGKDRITGFAIQLYALKSKRNWGIGDFTDLENLIEIASRSGVDVIGLNPLNVLNLDYPETASPYSSVSRLFLNPIYIDVEKIPLYEESDKDNTAIWYAKESEKIDYTKVFDVKMKALKKIYERLVQNKNSAYYKEFEEFKKADSGELHRLAVYEAIAHDKFVSGENVSKEWEKIYENALSSGVKKFEEAHESEIDFYKFLQFEADRQLKNVKAKIDEVGMAVGLYRDLPVGVSKGSAEVWGDKYLYMQGSGAGAPPDNYFPTGQKWELGAFNPFELKERQYKPFIRILRANMRYAGAIRIDHVMGLQRLYNIPDDKKEGTYIRYNEKEMMNILALESLLNKCMVVGECIGNVESGFDKLLRDKNIYMLGVLWSERQADGLSLKKPHEYERKYYASVGTHDLPPLKAWWFGVEISTMKNLGFFTEENARNGFSWRECERRSLLKALDEEGVWPEDRRRNGDYIYGENYPEGIEEAVNAYMAKTNSEVFLIELDNMLHQMCLQNLPGTDKEHPNWRTRLPVDLEDLENDIGYKRNINIIKRYR